MTKEGTTELLSLFENESFYIKLTTTTKAFNNFKPLGNQIPLWNSTMVNLKFIKRNSFSGDRDNGRVTTTFIQLGKLIL